MFIIGGFYVIIGIAMAFFLVPDPTEVGIEMGQQEVAYFNAQREGEIREQGYAPLANE